MPLQKVQVTSLQGIPSTSFKNWLNVMHPAHYFLETRPKVAPLSPSEVAEIREMLAEWRHHRALETITISLSSEEATESIPSGSVFSPPTPPSESSSGSSEGYSIAINMANAPPGIVTPAAWGQLVLTSGNHAGRTYDDIRLNEGQYACWIVSGHGRGDLAGLRAYLRAMGIPPIYYRIFFVRADRFHVQVPEDSGVPTKGSGGV